MILNRRRILLIGGSGLLSGLYLARWVLQSASDSPASSPTIKTPSNSPIAVYPKRSALPSSSAAFQLTPLPYADSALEPWLDRELIQLHYQVHAGYVDALNALIVAHPRLKGRSLDNLLMKTQELKLPRSLQKRLLQCAGGHANHLLYWHSMSPNGGGFPVGELATAIEQKFGGLKFLQQAFRTASETVEGSGWVWLVRSKQGLQVVTTANETSPLSQGLPPVLGIDLWEHAYFAKYSQSRSDYVDVWWNLVDWQAAEQRYQAINLG